jgi:GTP 3',8-cyclase
MPPVIVAQGRIWAEKFEYNLVEHCNFACDQCSHFSPYLVRGFPALDVFKADLSALARAYHVRRFRFLGGEPLLRKDIVDFIAVVEECGIADKIEICTNGSLFPHVDDEVFQRIDRLSISWYPDPRCDESKIDFARRKCAEFGVTLKVDRINHFRAMNVDDPIQDEQLVDRIYRSCLIAHSWGCQTIHRGQFYLCSRPIFTPAYLQKTGRTVPDLAAEDGCPLHEPDLLVRLVKYLSRESALASCAYCLGTAGVYAPWHSLTPDQRKKPTPAARDASQRISRVRMRYLLGFGYLERKILKAFPARRLARALNLLKNLPIRD